jgi:LysM repeat protein
MSEAYRDGEGQPPLRRRPRERRAVYRSQAHRGRLTFVLAFIAALGVAALYYQWTVRTTRYAVMAGDTPVAVLASQREAEQALTRFQRKYAPSSPAAVTCAEGPLTVQTIHAPAQVLTVDAAAAALDARLTVQLSGIVICVNGNPLVMVATMDDWRDTLSRMQERGLNGKRGIPTFKQRVTVGPYHYDKRNAKHPVPLLTPEEAAAYLVHPPEKNIHTVQKGDNFWSIATANGITVLDLKALNPGVDHTKLQPGDLVTLPDKPAPVTVVVRKR